MFLIVFISVFWTASKGLAALTGHAATHPVQAPYLAGTAVGSVPGRLPQVRAFIIAVMNSPAGQEDGCYRAKWALSPAAAPSPWDWAGGVWGAWWGRSFGERLWGLQLGCWAQRDLGPKVPAAVFSGGGSMGTSHAYWSWCYRLLIRNSSCLLEREAIEQWVLQGSPRNGTGREKLQIPVQGHQPGMAGLSLLLEILVKITHLLQAAPAWMWLQLGQRQSSCESSMAIGGGVKNGAA